jgi:hypothetical protein
MDHPLDHIHMHLDDESDEMLRRDGRPVDDE